MKKNKKMTPAAALAKIDRIETANKVVDKTADVAALVATLGAAAQFAGLLFPAARIPILVGRVVLGAGCACAALTVGKFALCAAANKTAAAGIDCGAEAPDVDRAAVEDAISDLTDTPASRHVRATLRRKRAAVVELVL